MIQFLVHSGQLHKMGEKAYLPQKNENEDNEQNDDFDDMDPEEFQMLDSQLDALNTALDGIEQKNDDIHSQLLQLLEKIQCNKEDLRKCQETADNNTSEKIEEQNK